MRFWRDAARFAAHAIDFAVGELPCARRAAMLPRRGVVLRDLSAGFAPDEIVFAPR